MSTRWTFRSLLAPGQAGLVALASLGCSGNPPPERADPMREAVQIGYGTQAPEEVTGSVGSLTAAEIERTRASTLEDLLRGRLAGVQVSRRLDGALSVRIRGTGASYNAGEPLWVIDGIPIRPGNAASALMGLSPVDIKRIDVLKDAGSAAIYGREAVNGAIIITTRRR